MGIIDIDSKIISSIPQSHPLKPARDIRNSQKSSAKILGTITQSNRHRESRREIISVMPADIGRGQIIPLSPKVNREAASRQILSEVSYLNLTPLGMTIP